MFVLNEVPALNIAVVFESFVTKFPLLVFSFEFEFGAILTRSNLKRTDYKFKFYIPNGLCQNLVT